MVKLSPSPFEITLDKDAFEIYEPIIIPGKISDKNWSLNVGKEKVRKILIAIRLMELKKINGTPYSVPSISDLLVFSDILIVTEDFFRNAYVSFKTKVQDKKEISLEICHDGQEILVNYSLKFQLNYVKKKKI